MTVRPSSQAGFTLLELLLVLGVAAIILVGIMQITRSWVDSESASSAGQNLARVSQITQKYIEAKFNVLTPTNDAMSDAALPGSTWTDLKTTLDQEGLLTNGALRSTFNVPLQIGFLIDSSGAQPVYRASIFTTQNLPNKRVLQAARQAGNSGGTITVTPATPATAPYAIGAFGQWKVDVNQLLPSGVFPYPRTDKTRGYLVALISYNQDTLCGPFLYRDTVSACSTANTMYTTLNMNNNDITNAADIATKDLDVSNQAVLGATTVAGNATFNGPTTASNGITVAAGGMAVSGDANFSNNVTMGGGALSASTLNVSTVQAQTIKTNQLNTGTMDVQGAMVVKDSMTVNGNMDVTNQVLAGSVNTGNVNAGTGTMTVGTMNINNKMNINGTVVVSPASGGPSTIVADHLVSDKCVNINGDNYGPGC